MVMEKREEGIERKKKCCDGELLHSTHEREDDKRCDDGEKERAKERTRDMSKK